MKALTTKQTASLTALIDQWTATENVLKAGQQLVFSVGIIDQTVIINDLGNVEPQVAAFKPGEVQISDIQHVSPAVFFPDSAMPGYVLSRAGVVTMGQLLRLSKADVMLLSKMGPTRVGIIERHLLLFGFSLSTELEVTYKEREVLCDKGLLSYEKGIVIGIPSSSMEDAQLQSVLERYKLSTVFDFSNLSRARAQEFLEKIPSNAFRVGFSSCKIANVSLQMLELFLKSLGCTFAPE